MARTIHEAINNIDLITPSTHDFFSINATGMPNGDPSLIASPGDARAFVPAPTLAKNLFKQAGQGPWALSFWTRTDAIENNKTYAFGVADVNAAGATSLDHPLSVIIWCYVTGGLSNVQFVYQGNTSHSFNISPAANTSWQFFVVNMPAPGGTIRIYTNTDNNFTDIGTAVAGTSSFNANQFFYIGRYGDSQPGSSATANRHLGKICFHDHILSLTECQLMYLVMTT